MAKSHTEQALIKKLDQNLQTVQDQINALGSAVRDDVGVSTKVVAKAGGRNAIGKLTQVAAEGITHIREFPNAVHRGEGNSSRRLGDSLGDKCEQLARTYQGLAEAIRFVEKTFPGEKGAQMVANALAAGKQKSRS